MTTLTKLVVLLLVGLLVGSGIATAKTWDLGNIVKARSSTYGYWVVDNYCVYLGTDKDASIKYDETTDDDLEITCANGIAVESPIVFDDTVDVDGAISLDTTTISESVTVSVTDVNATTYTVLVTDYLVASRYSEYGVCTVTIPTAQCISGRMIIISDAYGGASGNTLTVATEGGTTIGGAATATITSDHGALTLIANTQPTTNDWLIV